MPDENDLRRLLSETDAPHTLDAAKIVARSRRRRLPRQLAAGAVGVLAIVGVGVLAINVPALRNPAYTSADQSTMFESAPESEAGGGAELDTIKRGGADTLNVCGAPLAEVEPSRYGLELTVEAPPVVSPAASLVNGVARLTNTSTEPVDGFIATGPTLTMSFGNVVVAQGAPFYVRGDGAVSLQPGESVEYTVQLDLMSCSADGVQLLSPGDYELSAAVDFTPAELAPDEPVIADLVTGPLTSLTLN